MDFKARRQLSENHGCSHCDLGDEMVAEIERLRSLVGVERALPSLRAREEIARAVLGFVNVYRRADRDELGGTDIYKTIDQARAFDASDYDTGYLGIGVVTLFDAILSPTTGQEWRAPESKVLLLLEMIAKAGGEIDSTDEPHGLLNYFLDDGPDRHATDTFNQAIDRGLIETSFHDSFETSRAYLTDAGRALLPAPPVAEPKETP